MKPPAQLKPWLGEFEFLAWLRESQGAAEYQRKLVLWLTHYGKWNSAMIAEMAGVSQPAVWRWVSQYNRLGPQGIHRQGRGGRRRGHMSEDAEREFLHSLENEAIAGSILTAKKVHAALCKRLGKPVSLGSAYDLLHRHQWRKIGPRPRHVKADPDAQAAFKKTSRL